MPHVMIIKVRLKEVCFENLFSNSFKIEFMYVYPFITKPEVAVTTTRYINCLVGILLRNLIFLTPVFRCYLQRIALGSVIIYVEFPHLALAF